MEEIKEVHSKEPEKYRPSKEDLIASLQAIVDAISKMPPHAIHSPITHYDFASALSLLIDLARADCNDDT
jgi:hypothetical protein